MPVRGDDKGDVDLHLHSTYSDGILSPAELVVRAKNAGLRAISITDHDNVDGIKEGLEYGNRLGIEVISGVELSTVEHGFETHILGYFVDWSNRKLRRHLELLRRHRLTRAKEIVEKLRKLGCPLALHDVIRKSRTGSIGRPHIAEVLVDYGYVTSLNEAFWRYLGDSKPAFVPKYRIGSLDAIMLIKRAGGLSFLAHPGAEIYEELIVQFIKGGLNGIEVVHPKHSAQEIAFYRNLVNKYTILECGGSDYHSDSGEQAKIGEYVLPYRVVTRMKRALSST